MKDRNIQGAAGIAWVVVGIALWASDNAAGVVFLILGIAWISGILGREGESWTDKNPGIARWVLGGLLVLAVLITLLVLLGKYV